MPSISEILINIVGQDNASSTASSVQQSYQSMASSITNSISSMNTGLLNLNTVNQNLIGGLTGKSAGDLIFGSSSKADTNKVLINNMAETEEQASELYDTINNTTDTSLTSMQDLIPALNAFKSATGASASEIQGITGDMSNFGAFVLAQTGSTELATTAMMGLGKAIKGAYNSVDQYGVSEDALKRTGKWSGDEKDVKGFMEAVTEAVGSTDALMETNEGLDAQIKKAFSRGGKRIGNEFLPVIKDVKRGFIELDSQLGGNLSTSILAVSEGIETMNTVLFNVNTTVNGIESVSKAISTISDLAKTSQEAVEGMNNALETSANLSNMSSMASTTADAGGLIAGAGTGGQVVGEVSGLGADYYADLMASNGGGKMMPSREEYDAIMESVMGEIPKLSNYEPEERVSQIAELTKYMNNHPEMEAFRELVDGDIEDLYSIKSVLSNYDNELINLEDQFKKIQSLNIDSKEKKNLLAPITAQMESISDEKDAFYKIVSNVKSDGVSKVSDYLEDVARVDVLDNIDISQINADDEASKTLSQAIKGKFKNFGTRLSGAFDSVASIPSKISGKIRNVKDSISKFGAKLGEIKSDGLKGNLEKLDHALYNPFRKVPDVPDTGKTASNLEKVATGTQSASNSAGKIGKEAPKMATASAEVEATAVAETSLSGAFTSMIVPTLAVAAVIIIMIPIIAVIVSEALIFVKLLADFMEALNFDNIHLEGAVNGISQVATALAWVGVAMAAMSFASIMTGLAVITGGFIGILGPLDIAVDAIKQAGEKLSAFNSVQINENVASNIQSISTALGAVAGAMGALTWINITTGFSNFIAGALGFSSISDGLEQAKNDIIQASHKLQEFSSLTPLDEGVAQNIQNVCDSLASVGSAMEALRSIRDGQNWDNMIGEFMSGIFGEGLNIQEALDAVKLDIQEAANSLSGWTNLPDIPEDLGDKITKVSDALTSVNDAFQTLRGFRDDNIWDDMIGGLFDETDINTVLDGIITDINTAATKLGGLNIDDSVINEDLITKIQNIVKALTEVTNVAKGLTSLPPMDDFDSSIITTVVGNVQKAATAITGLNVGEINEDTITSIKNVADAMAQVSGVMTSLTSLPSMDDFDSTRITTAVTNVQTAATELLKLNETTFDSESVNSVLTNIQTALTNVRNTLSLATGFTEPSMNIGSQIISGVQTGLAPLSATIQLIVSTAIASAGLQALSGGANIGSQMNQGFQTSFKISTVISNEMNYSLQTIQGNTSGLVGAIGELAQQMVDEAKNKFDQHSPGKIARMMGAEMDYGTQLINSRGAGTVRAMGNMAQRIVNSFNPTLTNPLESMETSLNISRINSLRNMNQSSSVGKQQRPVSIQIGEGAVQLDARNLTTTESRQIMINAMEGLDAINGIDIRGV